MTCLKIFGAYAARIQLVPLLLAAIVLPIFGGYSTVHAEPPSLLKMFSRRAKVEANPSVNYELSEEEGPWMILAHTFLGENAKQRARELTLELRRDYNLPAYTYQEKFDYTGKADVGNPIQQTSFRGSRSYVRRYVNEIRYEAYAVLIGEYDSPEHPRIEEDLRVIKTAKCRVFGDPSEMKDEADIRNPVTAVKALHRAFRNRKKDESLGSMANAFLTKNPKLPAEYFASPQVDSFVRKLNDGMPYSLLECDGKYTVIVRTFSGFNTIVDGKKDKNFKPSIERLDQCAEDANRMTAMLRKEGKEAYQFHDRTRSIVTIGSYETLGRELPGGGFEYAPEILAAMDEYRAFNVDPRLAAYVRKKTDQALTAQCVGEIYPFDVQPIPVAVPKVEKKSFYRAALGFGKKQ